MNVKTLAIRLRTIRESRQLKQEYVAEQIGVSPATYSKIENGKVNLSAVRLQRIATALNVPVAVLLASKEESLPVEVGTIVVLQQQLVDCNRRIGALEQERTQSLDREQRLLNYIRLLEQQIG